jgi:hypothetical protein
MESAEWYRRKIGAERADALMRRAASVGKFTKAIEYPIVKLYLDQKLAEFGGVA